MGSNPPEIKKGNFELSIPRNGRGRPLFGKYQLQAVDDMSKRGVSMFDVAMMSYLIGLSKYNGVVYATQREIADYAGTYPANVNKSLKRLKSYGYLQEVDGGLRIDPCFCQFGTNGIEE